MFRPLHFMLVALPMLILGQDQTVPLTVGNYITTLLIPLSLAGPSQGPYTVVVNPTAPVVPAAVTNIPSSAVVQTPTAVTNMVGPSVSFSSYPGLVSPPPGVVSPPPGVVTGLAPGIVASAPRSNASGNAESVFLSLISTATASAIPNTLSSAVGVLPNPSSIASAASVSASQSSVNAESVFSSIITGYTSTALPPFVGSSLFASATSRLTSATAGSLSNTASAFTTVTISSIGSIPIATSLATGTGIFVVPLPNGGSTTVFAAASGPSLTSAIAESLLSSTSGSSITSTAAGAGTSTQPDNPNTRYPTADVSGNTMTPLVTQTSGIVASTVSAANGAQQTIAPPAGNHASPLALPLCLSTFFAGFAAVLALS